MVAASNPHLVALFPDREYEILILTFEKELKDEINRDAVERAKTRLKSKLIAIDSARTVLRNLEREYKDLIFTISAMMTPPL